MAKKQTNRILIILGIVIVVLIIIAVVFKGKSSSAEEVKVTEVQPRTIIEKVSASGKIYPEVEVAIIPEISGEIIELYVEEGDSVRKGEPLVRINPNVYQDALERAQAAVLSAQANLGNARARAAQAEAQLERAKQEFNRSKRLYNEKVISQAEFEAAEASFNIAKAEADAAKESVNAAGYNVRSAEATLKEMRNNLGKTTVYSPMTGIVSLLNVEEGKVVVGVAQMAVTEMMRIANFDEMEARVEVSENDILKIKIGDTAEVEVEAYNDRIFKGIVTQISSSSNTRTGALTTEQATNFTVKIRLLKESYTDLFIPSKSKFPFLPGMSATVEIITNRASNVLTVPIEAVTTREAEKDEDEEKPTKTAKKTQEEIKEYVFVYDNGIARQTEVKTGIQDDQYIQILSGVKEGTDIIYSPYSVIHRTLKDEMKVERETEKKSTASKD